MSLVNRSGQQDAKTSDVPMSPGLSLTKKEVPDKKYPYEIHGLPRDFQDKLIVHRIEDLTQAHLGAERLYVNEQSMDSSRRGGNSNQSNKFKRIKMQSSRSSS